MLPTDAVTNPGASRNLAALALVAFLILAFALAVTVSRGLEGEIGRLVEGARRLAGGDFSTPVPAEGGDEFAKLGREFNTMAEQLDEKIEQLRRQRAELEDSIRSIGAAAAANLDRDGLLAIVLRSAVAAVQGDAGRAVARDGTQEPLLQRAVLGDVGAFAEAIRSAEEVALGSGRPGEGDDGGMVALAHPLGAASRPPVGVITVARGGEPFSPQERDLIHYLAAQATVSLENVDLHDVVQRQAVTDELTGLFNHRRFQEVVDGEVERARRFETPLGVVMLDIDNFKRVNDTYGHQQGDLVLREVSRVLKEQSREIDEPARYGGEELAVALPQTDLEGAANFAERVRAAIEALGVRRLDGSSELLRVTASLGVAALPHSAEGKDDLVAAADAALYRAKAAGKNRVERADAPAPTARAK
jgi:diguanylate cyclase (GGDEF)-like protein